MNESVTYIQGSNYNPVKNSFLDKFEEPNANAIRHTCEKSI